MASAVGRRLAKTHRSTRNDHVQNQKLVLYVFTAPDPTVPRAVLGLGREAGCGCGFCNAVWHRRRFFI
jgi:hypothetical protein